VILEEKNKRTMNSNSKQRKKIAEEWLQTTLPTDQKPSEMFKRRLRQWFGKWVRELHACVNFLNHNASVFDRISKVMPFDTNVLGTRTELIGFVDEFKASSVIFIDGGLVHSSSQAS
jgi:hypothetical protein